HWRAAPRPNGPWIRGATGSARMRWCGAGSIVRTGFATSRPTARRRPMTQIDDKLKELGIVLPEASVPVASYVPVTRSGNLLYVSGQISQGPDGLVAGRLGGTLDTAAGQKAAELCAINILSHVANATALDNISQILKLTVLVSSTPDFTDQHLVANGASDLFIKLLG